jgi:heptosyltransferase I
MKAPGRIKTDLHSDRRSGRIARILDQVVGPAALVLLGLLKQRRLPPANPKRIVLLQTAALGDMALMSGAVERLHIAFPMAEIVVVAGPDNAVLAPFIQDVDRVVKIEPQKILSSLRQIRKLNPDYLIDFGPWPRINAIFAALSGAAYTIGFKSKGTFRHYAYDQFADHSDIVHEIDNHQSLVGLLVPHAPKLSPRLTAREKLPEALKLERSYVVFHAWPSGAGKVLKQWPTTHWAKLAEWVANNDLDVVLTGAKGDMAAADALFAGILSACPKATVVNLAGKINVAQLLPLLKSAAYVVSVNTGVMHLAAALGAATVGLSGPTNPHRWGPYGAHTRSVSPSAGHHSYLHFGFEYPKGAISPMPHISVEAVIQQLESFSLSGMRQQAS